MTIRDSLFPQIYVDLDDVLGETARVFIKVLKESFGKSVEFKDIFSFNLGKSFNLNKDELTEFMYLAHEPSVLMSVTPIKGAAEGLSKLKKYGLYITVISGRPVSTYEISKEWLRRNNIPYDSFNVVNKYGHDIGSSFHKALGLRSILKSDFCFSIEDSPKMTRFLAQHIKIPIILHDRPWNQNIPRLPQNLKNLVIRCRDWQEITETAILYIMDHQ